MGDDIAASEFPRSIGRVATRELAINGFTTFAQLAEVRDRDLLAIHGVGPKAVRLLAAELAARRLGFRSDA
ncbi:hypothetical protein [Agromyces sp. Marseille-Q5079]|uniref:hypothetical protein n=1 Tax=Agromyces sp. Marseille-Q5079 TaxID=3439059 RepID=UPI003D9C84B5